MNTYSEIEYIKNEYIKQGLLNKNGIKLESTIDYYIYPWEKGYIPKCSVCTEMFNKFIQTKKDGKNEINAPHKSCGCLWFNWYKIKILTINPNIKFIDYFKS